MRKQKEIILLKDNEWSMVDGEFCRVVSFTPLVGYVDEDGEVKAVNSRTPYGSITIEHKKFPQKITGYINHKLDFLNLWNALKKRELKSNEEVIIVWSKNNYKSKLLKFLPGFWPKLRIVICPKGFWDKVIKENWDNELINFTLDEIKIAEWKPDIIK